MKIVMLGAPGAGKGTQAVRLAQELGIPHISTGDIFRKNLREGTELGKQVQGYLNSGGLVPDELTCEIVADRLAQEDCANGYILDGFPRSIPQAEMLKAFLEKHGGGIDAAINIDVPDEEIVGRLSARRSDPETGAVYNLLFNPPPAELADRLIQREDDKPETVQSRLATYHETTEPIIEWYGKEGVLKNVSGTKAGPEEVYARVMEVIKGM
ncbi:MAG: adenylate kinase [Candidatus Hydrogenedens sp.]|nr:adenylate kinase [Candidatus Hydrogenedentota bacterium]NLF59387.1 adenylate kinase [Candidatus Hydrogenedens sp.]